MSQEAKAAEGTEGDAPAEEEKKSKLPMILAMVLGPIVLTGIVFAVLYFTGLGAKIFGHDTHKPAPTSEAAPPTEVSYLEIKELLINLTKSTKKSRATPFLRLSLKLELPNAEAQKTADLLRPRLIDAFQVYLRQLRTEDLEGGAGLQRLREELLKQANAVLKPIKVTNILFDQMLVQ